MERFGVFSAGGSERGTGDLYRAISPIDGTVLGSVHLTGDAQYDRVVEGSLDTFSRWRLVPAPQRGQMVREIGDILRAKKRELGLLVTNEVGKIVAEGEGEIQVAIDIAEFAVGLSRQLYGNAMHSERPNHRMLEQWHPLGVVGVITAFNFPAAVWAWNAFIAAVCGDTVVWKPSERGLMTAIALTELCGEVATRWGFPGLFSLVTDSDGALGKRIAADSRIPLVSATGSVRMGRSVAARVGERLGRSLLELGGNNAVIVMGDADLSLVIRSTVFGAVGTAGQRCTTTRRLFVEQTVYSAVVSQLISAYGQVRIGDPRESATLMGPLISEAAVAQYEHAITQAQQQGGKVVYGGGRVQGMLSGWYVQPTIIEVSEPIPMMEEETFAPILYVCPIKSLQDAIEKQNAVSQGLSSAIFTQNVRCSEAFLSAAGSDCGIANVNLGTSGAEIGGAFGGEKDTGGGRESGSDSWKQYMRRQTTTINFGAELPLAQGIMFELS